MDHRIAIVGAGVSGLTCAVLFAEHGCRAASLRREPPGGTTSAAAAAMWFPYDAGPADKVVPWALETYEVFRDLSAIPTSGVSMIELRQFSPERTSAKFRSGPRPSTPGRSETTNSS